MREQFLRRPPIINSRYQFRHNKCHHTAPRVFPEPAGYAQCRFPQLNPRPIGLAASRSLPIYDDPPSENRKIISLPIPDSIRDCPGFPQGKRMGGSIGRTKCGKKSKSYLQCEQLERINQNTGYREFAGVETIVTNSHARGHQSGRPYPDCRCCGVRREVECAESGTRPIAVGPAREDDSASETREADI
jgi:hypothetical protein